MTFARSSLACTFAALLCSGAALAHGPDDRPPPGLPGPLVGAIEITNERERPVEIYIDGRFVIELRPRTTETIDQVLDGTRLVSYPGSGRGDAWQTDRVEVREGRRSALRIAPLRGQASIVNHTGMTLHVMLDELDLGMLLPGRELLTQPLPAGTYQLSAAPHGWNRVRPEVQTLVIVPGEVARAELRSFSATLVVTNPFRENVQLFVEGQRVTKLRPLESERIDDLEPGRVRVELRKGPRVLAADMVELVPGREAYFAPQLARRGALDVSNPTREAVRVTIDEMNGFRLAPGERRLVGDLEPGPHTIQLTTDDGRIVKHQTEIGPGETQRFEVPSSWVAPPPPAPQPVRPPPR